MLLFERTHDYALLRAIATHPRVWEALADDATPSRDEWHPTEHEAYCYVLVRGPKRQIEDASTTGPLGQDGDEVLGFFLLVPQNAVCWEIHTCLLPCAWGAKARDAAAGIVRWLWAHTNAQRLVTNVPASNRLALRFALRAGMTEYGRNPNSYLKRGQLEDQILLGLSR